MMDYFIARTPYKNKESIQEKISPEEWIELVESRPEIVWIESTDLGQHIPESRKKRSGMIEWDIKRGYYHLRLGHYDYGYIVVYVNSVITPKRLRYLLEISKSMNALLLKNGTKIIDEAYIDQLEIKKKAKRTERALLNKGLQE